jgi:predicted metal-dependent hydrolase
MDTASKSSEQVERRRLVPDEPFPPYSYVTGQFPHPLRDPQGHSFGKTPERCPKPDADRWFDCRPYLYGLDLFNYGYYWEAHETWEQVWHAAGRKGPLADFIKGLIKLAAAGVKARERRPEGVRRHARRAAELFSQVARILPRGPSTYMGLSLSRLIEIASDLESRPVVSHAPAGTKVDLVFDFVLSPASDR